MRAFAHRGAVAQLVAHLHGMQGVRGSNPLSSTKIARIYCECTGLDDPTEAYFRVNSYGVVLSSVEHGGDHSSDERINR